MKKLKIAFWAVLLGFIFLIIYQNSSFFLGRQSLGINLWVANYRIPEILNLALFFICFIAGLLLGSYFFVLEKLKFNKKIKMLNANKDSHQAEISALQQELEKLRSEAADADIDAKTVVISSESQEPTEAQGQQQ